jgi:FKBP-type peptidyl-prolyl cis-trans isomerase FklB
MMPVGSKWELYIPQQLAYGDRGAGQNIKPYSAPIFTLELLGIEAPATKAEPAAQKAAKAAVKKTPAAKKKK